MFSLDALSMLDILIGIHFWEPNDWRLTINEHRTGDVVRIRKPREWSGQDYIQNRYVCSMHSSVRINIWNSVHCYITYFYYIIRFLLAQTGTVKTYVPFFSFASTDQKFDYGRKRKSKQHKTSRHFGSFSKFEKC